MVQSNVKQGDIVVLAGEDLTGKEDHLVKMTHDSGTAELQLPSAIDDQPLYVLIDGDEALVRVVDHDHRVAG